MKKVIFDAFTKEEMIIDVPDDPIIEPISQEPSMEDRLASVESTQSQVIDVLAEITGVTL